MPCCQHHLNGLSVRRNSPAYSVTQLGRGTQCEDHIVVLSRVSLWGTMPELKRLHQAPTATWMADFLIGHMNSCWWQRSCYNTCLLGYSQTIPLFHTRKCLMGRVVLTSWAMTPPSRSSLFRQGITASGADFVSHSHDKRRHHSHSLQSISLQNPIYQHYIDLHQSIRNRRASVMIGTRRWETLSSSLNDWLTNKCGRHMYASMTLHENPSPPQRHLSSWNTFESRKVMQPTNGTQLSMETFIDVYSPPLTDPDITHGPSSSPHTALSNSQHDLDPCSRTL